MGGNQYKEFWTIEKAQELLERAVKESENKENDFIGEVCRNIKTTRNNLKYIAEKFPTLEHLLDEVKSNCETNCFQNAKKGEINVAMGIINLKSNHGWTDRSESNVNVKNDFKHYTETELENKIKDLLNKKNAD